MRIDHHPSAQLISDYVIANVSPGVGLAVAAHLELCAVCRMSAAAAEGRGWQADVLEGPSAKAADADLAALPETIRGLHLPVWTPMRKSVQGVLAPQVSGLGEYVYLLRADPGAEIGVASFRSAFLLLVAAGGLEIDGRKLATGDFVELDGGSVAAAADAGVGATLLVVADAAPLRLRRGAP